MSTSQYVNIPGSNLNWLSPVPLAADLPAGGNSIGDTRLVTSSGEIYYWTGMMWQMIAGSGGGVTAVTASLPISSSGGSTPNISIPKSDSTHNGYLSNTDWNTFNGKQSALTFSDSLSNSSGTVTLVNDSATPGNTKYYGTNSGGTLGFYSIPATGVTSVSGTSPIASSGGSTPAISISQASSTTDGYLSSTDWSIFNSKGSGTVTSVGATSPVASSGGTTPTISMHVADSTHDGYLSSTDWSTFNSKGSGTVTSVSGTAPVVSTGGATPAISMHVADSTHDGYLSSTDWSTFNGKQSSLTFSDSLVNTSGTVTLVGDAATPSASQYYGTDSSSTLGFHSLPTPGTGTVTSVTFTGDGTVLSSTPSSAVTTSGTVTASLNTQSPNLVLAGPATGTSVAAPTFRALVAKDIPSLSYVSSVSATSPVSSTGGATPDISISQASSTTDGYLSSTDWSAFDAKQAALTPGNISETTSSVLTISNGTSSTVGPNVTIQVKQASSTQSGYLSSTDWSTFNSKGSGTVTSVSATSPVSSTGGATPDISISQSSASADGYLSSTDWSAFNGKQSSLTFSDSLANTSGTVTLVNDSATPGATKYYGTDSGSTLGYHSLPSGGGYWSQSGFTLYPTTYNDRILLGGATDDGASTLQAAGPVTIVDQAGPTVTLTANSTGAAYNQTVNGNGTDTISTLVGSGYTITAGSSVILDSGQSFNITGGADLASATLVTRDSQYDPMTYTAVATGSAGNSVGIQYSFDVVAGSEYVDVTGTYINIHGGQPQQATLSLQGIQYLANNGTQNDGTPGNSIEIIYYPDAITEGYEVASITGPTQITVTICDGTYGTSNAEDVNTALYNAYSVTSLIQWNVYDATVACSSTSQLLSGGSAYSTTDQVVTAYAASSAATALATITTYTSGNYVTGNGYSNLNGGSDAAYASFSGTVNNYPASLFIEGVLSASLNNAITLNQPILDNSNWPAPGVSSIHPNDRQLYDSTNHYSLDWNGRFLYDSTDSIAMSWASRFLIQSNPGGSNVMADWSTGYGVEFPNGIICNSLMLGIDTDGRKLNDSTIGYGICSVDWANRYLYDFTGGNIAMSWANGAPQFPSYTSVAYPTQGQIAYDFTNNNPVFCSTYGVWQSAATNVQMSAMGIMANGGGSVLTAGTIGYMVAPFSGTIVGWSIMADAVGDVSFDIYAANNAVPSSSIVASAPPALSSAQLLESTTLTGWSTAVTAGDVFTFVITGTPVTITNATLTLRIQKS